MTKHHAAPSAGIRSAPSALLSFMEARPVIGKTFGLTRNVWVRACFTAKFAEECTQRARSPINYNGDDVKIYAISV